MIRLTHYLYKKLSRERKPIDGAKPWIRNINHSWAIAHGNLYHDRRDRKLMSSKWLLRKKFNADGSISCYKARLVACGFSQVPSMDDNKTFSLVLCITSFWALLMIATQFHLFVHQMDVRTDFLHEDFHEEIYMEKPPPYISKDHHDYVCKLVKSLYDLK
jgi:hypothetical protein